ncbi:MAG: hypothetical protein IJG33_03120 [Selenomonadaceae bacterium]|nr:hypothetical protein [Selenomonadaceae bacterium]
MATNQDYKNINYDRLAIWVKKGSRDSYKQSAAELGISLAMLVQSGVEEYISNHAGEVMTPQPKHEPLSAADKQLVDEFNQLPVETQKAFMKVFTSINKNMPQ